ncbi:alkaline phosphatase [Olivibacter sitiensis]|uniref:alkaline phosphatase n=1 Tax=Olivibacter sitiensis TaxID=376470 RepID=UPI00041AC3A9|nr:alkaline phosphatase [Olivibacter sitiensis]
MKRREFFRNGTLAAIGASILSPFDSLGRTVPGADNREKTAGSTKNIIFLVSDGMSTGTLNMANLLKIRKEGKNSRWMSLYEEHTVARALMDTASASSMVTDSAAASSAWGGGKRVANGSLNVNDDGSFNKPILQKFKDAGKSVGCVTTVPITHATPAGFCVNSAKRSAMPEIALLYHDLRFDVMMGGGTEFFDAEKREDKLDVFGKFEQSGYAVVKDRKAMLAIKENESRPILGVFHEDGLPYTLDRENDASLKNNIPTLAEMTRTAINKLKQNKKGFVLQVEGGKVDWAAHANDASALLYDQLAFDDAVAEAIAFAEADRNTLVIITTDHGNANPGLFYGDKANAHFDSLQRYRHTNDWILNGTRPNTSISALKERVEYAQSWIPTDEEAREVLSHYQSLDEAGLYNPRKLPFRSLALIQQEHTSIGWGAMDHSADYVELAMFGPGKEMLMPFVKNYELHQLMLDATGVARS